MVLLAIVAAFVSIPYSALILLLLGIVLSVMTPITEILERTAYLIIAVAAPNAADNLDVIPVLGSYLNATVDGIAIATSGADQFGQTFGLALRIGDQGVVAVEGQPG